MARTAPNPTSIATRTVATAATSPRFGVRRPAGTGDAGGTTTRSVESGEGQ